MGSYSLRTTWHVEVPRPDVWEALRDGERYPEWWPGMERVEVLEPGAVDGTGRHLRITTRSRLPYVLVFETVGRQTRAPDLIVVDAVGELQGTGTWTLEEDDGLTTATYTWQVATTKRWMQLLEPFARPAFIWNHHVVMGWGGAALARRLEGRLVGQEHAPTVRPTDWVPLASLTAGLVGLLALRSRARRP